MNALLRQRLKEKLFEQAKISNEIEIAYKHCKQIASALDCEPNSVARLLGFGNFKTTQTISPEIEQKIADYLGYQTFDLLEQLLMLEITFFEFRDYYQKKCIELKKGNPQK